ncbi:MAG: hypothetical protein JWO82_2272, partial [Akkermansiaceae bacterium]|nr:hypothetical protein [Akkermansiaceae bacterium]
QFYKIEGLREAFDLRQTYPKE